MYIFKIATPGLQNGFKIRAKGIALLLYKLTDILFHYFLTKDFRVATMT